MTKVDIVVPCYNYGRFLEECVVSILDQSVRDVRVLIIDDASSDDSLSAAQKLADADSRVSIIAHPENRGHIATYNEGIAWASADYFLLLSADDVLVTGALERAVSIMDANPDVVLTHGQSLVWNDDLPPPKIEPVADHTWAQQDLVEEMCKTATNFVATPTAIVRTCSQQAVGGYRASLPHSGDMEMWLRLGAHGAVAHINTVQAIYRKHSNAMSNPFFAEVLSDYRQRKLAFDSFFGEYGGVLPASRMLQAQARHVLADIAFGRGVGFLRRGSFGSGFGLISWAMDLDPRLRYFPPFWQLLKIPGPEGREWALSIIKRAAGKLGGHGANQGTAK
jgi:glycosyltransferase involved in cell wall biosynthesis